MARRKKGKDGYYREKRTYKGVTYDIRAKDEKELEEKIQNRKKEIDANLLTDGKRMTVLAWAQKWIELKKTDVSEPVLKRYSLYLNKYIIPEIGNKYLTDVLASDCRAIINKDLSKSLSHRQKLKVVLSSMFSAAVQDRLITINPAAKIKVSGSVKNARRALTDEEAELLLKVCESHYAGLWIKMLYYTGIRPQESAPLKWKDIDKDTHEVCITSALKSDGKVGPPKTKSGIRRVVIPEPFYSELMSHEGNPDDYLFPSQNGGMMTHQTMRRRWKSVLRAMDIALGREMYRNKLIGKSKIAGDLTLYCLRHTYCTNLCRANIPIDKAVRLMGHSKADMILEVYGHYTQDQADAVRETLSQHYSPTNDSKNDENRDDDSCENIDSGSNRGSKGE